MIETGRLRRDRTILLGKIILFLMLVSFVGVLFVEVVSFSANALGKNGNSVTGDQGRRQAQVLMNGTNGSTLLKTK